MGENLSVRGVEYVTRDSNRLRTILGLKRKELKARNAYGNGEVAARHLVARTDCHC